MHTVVLRNRPRKGSSGATFTIEVVGDSPVKDAVQQSIRDLEHHPAKAARRSLIDMLSIIEKHNFQIRFTEHSKTEDDMEAWLFVLQG
jgi:hypothetical protein